MRNCCRYTPTAAVNNSLPQPHNKDIHCNGTIEEETGASPVHSQVAAKCLQLYAFLLVMHLGLLDSFSSYRDIEYLLYAARQTEP